MPLYRIDNKVVFFVHIPKTGGSSIENVLENMGVTCLNKKPPGISVPAQHFHAEIYDVLVPQEFYDYGLLVCRNPYTRLLSEFRHQLAGKRIRNVSFDSWAKKALKKYKTNASVHHNHIRPQVEFLSEKIEIYKFEDGLQLVVDGVCNYCGMNESVKLPWIKRFEKKEIQISHQTLKKVASFYANDFEHFGYDPEDLSFALTDKIVIV